MRTAFLTLVLATTACGTNPSDGDDDIPTTCGDGVVDPGEQCDDGNPSAFDGCRPDCTKVDPLQPTPMAWQYFEIPGTQCIDGSAAGFSVNFNPTSRNLVVYLEGGGACFNRFCDSLFTRSANQPTNGGIFDRANAANPFGDWTWVYVPYCSGDVYGGSADTMVGGQLRHFHGYSNMTSFLEHLVPSFTVDRVVLTGSSAGGFGAAANAAQTQRAYGATPVALLDDSGPPLTSDVFPPCLQKTWREAWGLDKTLLADCGAACTDPNDFVATSFAQIRATFPEMKIGVFSSVGDQTIRAFAGYGWSGGFNVCGEIPSAVTAPVFRTGLDELRMTGMANPTFGTYYITGSSHTILRSPSLYTTMVGGTPLAQWIANAVSGTSSHVGP